MKKITLILFAMLAFSLQGYAQFSFPAVPGPENVVAGTPTIITINDGANGAGAPAGAFGIFTITVDWEAGAGGPWSGEADLTVETADDIVLVDPASSGAAGDGNPTTLTFTGVLPSGYDPSVDGILDITLNQSFAGSEANWSNIVVTIDVAPEVPVNDDCTAAQSLSCQETLSAQTLGSVDGEIWYSFTGTVVDDEVTVSLCGSGFDTIVTVYDACGGLQVAGNDDSCGLQSEVTFTSDGATTYLISVTGFNGATGNVELSLACVSTTPPANDECVDAIALDCTNNSDSGNSDLASDDDADGDADVWYSFTGTVVGDNVTVSLCGSSFDTIMEIFDACGGASVASNDDSCSLQSEVDFVSDGVTTYLIRIQGFNGATGTYDINITCQSANTPTNNDCATAEAIACNDTVSGNTTFATDSDTNGSFDVWYSYADTVVGDNVTASLCGSAFDTIITVFDACGGTEVASNDDFCSLQSEVSWVSDGLTTYLIRVEGFNTATGTYDLTMTCDSQPVPDNDDCVDAETIVCGVQYTGDTTFGSPEDPDPGFCGTSAGTGGAVWYTFIGANSNNAGAAPGSEGDEVTLDLSLSTFDTKIRVFTGVCGDLTCLDGDDDGGTGTTSLLTFDTTVGTEYYVLVHGFSGNAGVYTMDVTCVAPLGCVPPTFSVANDSNNCPTDNFTIAVDITSLGTPATSVNILVDGLIAWAGVDGTATPYLIGGLSGGTDYDITVEDAADDTCTVTQAITTDVCPPENDDVAGAIDLPVGSTLCEDPILGTNVGATTTVENDNEADCGFFDPEGDVWFKVMVPSTGELTIETSAADANSITDTLMTVYSGTSGSLVEIACSDDEGTGLFSLIELTGLTEGDVLLVRVWEFGDNLKGNFDICAWSPTTLGVDDNTFDGFSYFPNPVKDVLTLNSPRPIDTIEVFNMLGQRIIAVDSQNTIQNIDMSNVQSGAYIVKVSIGDQTKAIRVIKQ